MGPLRDTDPRKGPGKGGRAVARGGMGAAVAVSSGTGASPGDPPGPAPVERRPLHSSNALPKQRAPPPGGGGIARREPQIQMRKKLRKVCGKIAGKLRCPNQTSRSLKKQHFCTGETQGTNKHAMGTSTKQLRKNCRKLRKNCRHKPPPGPSPFRGVAHGGGVSSALCGGCIGVVAPGAWPGVMHVSYTRAQGWLQPSPPPPLSDGR